MEKRFLKVNKKCSKLGRRFTNDKGRREKKARKGSKDSEEADVDMNVRKRLKKAYKNVTFSADRTWTRSPNDYQNRNMELHLAEHAQSKELHRGRPRNVRECIPSSRLAKYSNYVYNESREMSYSSSISISDSDVATSSPIEPWEMPEVGDLYKWFLKRQPEDNCSRLEVDYESPFLKVSGFDEKTLKTRITEDRVKKIWKDVQFWDPYPRTEHVHVNFFTSPMKNCFFINNQEHYSQNWLRHVSISRDFEQLEQLAKAFKEQASSVAKTLEEPAEPPEQAPTEILYSEVLQGLSPSRKLLSSLKPDHKSVPTDEGSSLSQDSFTNYTILTSQKVAQEESSKSDSFSKVSPQTTNKCVPHKTTPANIYLQSDLQRFKYPVQQTYFYPSAQSVHPWIPPNVTSCYPGQNWFTPPPVCRIFGSNPATNCESSRYFECGRGEEAQIKEESVDVDSCIEEHPISNSISEDLEIQALEQYSSSLFQELERQAIEQYASYPE